MLLRARPYLSLVPTEQSPKTLLAGSALKAMRGAAGMTQAELAKAAGISASHLSYFESGQRKMARDKVAAALEALLTTTMRGAA